MDHDKYKIYKFNINLVEFDEDEKVICEIRKHIFGLYLIYFTGFLIGLFIMIFSTYISIWLENNSAVNGLSGNSNGWLVMLVGIFLTVSVAITTMIYSVIFRNNIVLVTTEKIAQVLNKSLFNRKVSQLNISDVQDVTVSQIGVFARALNYGTIVIETAGEQQNYTFTYAPKPYECAKQIISAREINVKQFGN